MADITTVWNQTRGDWVQLGAVLQSGHDLQTAVLISIFTDATASTDDVIPDNSADPRGWWGDAGQTYPIGSKLWLYMRTKATEQTRVAIEHTISNALQWLIDDGVAAAIAVDANWLFTGALGVIVTITQPNGAIRNVQFQTAWAGVNSN